jgi:hypothetical protein
MRVMTYGLALAMIRTTTGDAYPIVALFVPFSRSPLTLVLVPLTLLFP